eukprot:TRINITY_DN5505_c0_g1_i1.p1 TRINITY_DN5505_c0_g1~~TRINITY_DN5505_c0_g1_i1.p1  ORF type:complete len:386 (+),score=80.13 TRINITY_DN5505_c0_g1_i1:43-1200(+)
MPPKKERRQQNKQDALRRATATHAESSHLGKPIVVCKDISERYDIESEMLEGQFAKVFKGYTKEDKQLRAIKTVIIEKDQTEGKDRIQIAWLAHEVEISRRVVHPNIVTLYEVVRTETTINLIYEMMDCDLWACICHKKTNGTQFTEQECGYFIKQLLEAVAYLHSHSIVHRDIKPENILVNNATNTLKLTDFGIAKVANSDVCTPFGSSSYMAPEIVSGVCKTASEILKMAHTEIVKVRSEAKLIDIWACGLILYLLLVGSFPAVAGRSKEKLEQFSKLGEWSEIVFAKCAKNKLQLADDAKELVVSLLQLDPSARPSASQSLQHPFILRCGTSCSPSTNDEQVEEVQKGDGDFALSELVQDVNDLLVLMRENMDTTHEKSTAG